MPPKPKDRSRSRSDFQSDEDKDETINVYSSEQIPLTRRQSPRNHQSSRERNANLRRPSRNRQRTESLQSTSSQPDALSQPQPSTSKVIRAPPLSRNNPVYKYSISSIEEIDSFSKEEMKQEDLVPLIEQMQAKKEPFVNIVRFFLKRRALSADQTKEWLKLIDHHRKSRSLSCLPTDLQTSDPPQVRENYRSSSAINKLYEKLCKHEVFQAGKNTELLINGDMEAITDSPSEPLELPECKKGVIPKTKCEKLDNLIKMVAKEILTQKKKSEEASKRSIEVTRHEIIDNLYDVAEHMAKIYLPKIDALATYLDPGPRRRGSDCERGSYDDSDSFLPDTEDKRSRLAKMAQSVDPTTLAREGLLAKLIIALPLCLFYTDNVELEEFINILKNLKENQDKSIPEDLQLKVPKAEDSLKAKKTSPVEGNLVVHIATIEASPSQDSLAGIPEISSIEEDSNATNSDAASSKSCSTDFQALCLKFADCEGSQSTIAVENYMIVAPIASPENTEIQSGSLEERTPSEAEHPQDLTANLQSNVKKERESDISPMLEESPREKTNK